MFNTVLVNQVLNLNKVILTLLKMPFFSVNGPICSCKALCTGICLIVVICSPHLFVLIFSVSELFTVKLHYGGVFKEEPKTYVGGDFEYFDFCDVDMMSLVELVHMLKECNVFGASVFYYRLPATDWVRGLFPLSNNEEVVLMCELVPPSRVVYVYADTLEPLVSIPHVEMESQEFNPSQDPNLEFVDNTNARGGERQQEDVASPEIDDDDGNVDRWWTSSDSEDEDYVASSERERVPSTLTHQIWTILMRM